MAHLPTLSGTGTSVLFRRRRIVHRHPLTVVPNAHPLLHSSVLLESWMVRSRVCPECPISGSMTCKLECTYLSLVFHESGGPCIPPSGGGIVDGAYTSPSAKCTPPPPPCPNNAMHDRIGHAPCPSNGIEVLFFFLMRSVRKNSHRLICGCIKLVQYILATLMWTTHKGTYHIRIWSYSHCQPYHA